MLLVLLDVIDLAGIKRRKVSGDEGFFYVLQTTQRHLKDAGHTLPFLYFCADYACFGRRERGLRSRIQSDTGIIGGAPVCFG